MTTTTTTAAPTTTNGTVDNNRQFLRPRASLETNKDGHVLKVEMPGVGGEGVEISVENNELTVVGNRTASAQRGELIYRESRRAGYRRVFELDPSIDTSRIEARMEQGILSLSLPKSESLKPRKIVVE